MINKLTPEQEKREEVKMAKIITICAFTDNQPNSVAYRKFKIGGPRNSSHHIDNVVDFYRRMIEKENVNVISTRKVNVSDESKA